MQRVGAIADADAGADGVALDTQTSRNVDYYRRFGYEVLSHARLGELETWLLHRPRR